MGAREGGGILAHTDSPVGLDRPGHFDGGERRRPNEALLAQVEHHLVLPLVLGFELNGLVREFRMDREMGE